jgi:hypothetical protein
MNLSFKIALGFLPFLLFNGRCSAAAADSIAYFYQDSTLSDIPDSAVAYCQGKKAAEAKLLGLVEKTLWGGPGARIQVVCYKQGARPSRAVYLVGFGRFGLFEKIRPVGDETKAVFINWPGEIKFSGVQPETPLIFAQ